MSSSTPLERLKEEHRKIEEELQLLREQKRKIDERFSSILEEEKRLIEDMRKCRDLYAYNKLEIRLNIVSRSRKAVESEKEETERKLRGYEEELNRIRARIEYLKPKS